MSETPGFHEVDMNGHKFYLPQRAAEELQGKPSEQVAPYEQRADVQERRTQDEVIGWNGLGSLRSDSASTERDPESMPAAKEPEPAEPKEVSVEKGSAREIFDILVKRGKEAARRLKNSIKNNIKNGIAEWHELIADGEVPKDSSADIADIMISDTAKKLVADASREEASEQEVAAGLRELENVRSEYDQLDSKDEQSEATEKTAADLEQEVIANCVAKIQRKIMQSEGAQQAFAEGGEEAYVAYITEQFRNNPKLVKLAQRLGYNRGNSSDSPEPVDQRALPAGPKPKELTTGHEKESLVDDPEFQELLGKVSEARTAYAKLSAQRRRISTFGYKKKLEEARIAYENLRDQAGVRVVAAMREAGMSDEEIKGFAHQAGVEEYTALSREETEQRIALSESKNKVLRRFYDWWAHQGGGEKFFSKHRLLGTLKKAAVLSAVGFVPGVGMGLLGAAVLGPIVGGTLGAAVARSVSRGIAASKVNKEAGERVVVAEEQSKEQGKDAILYDPDSIDKRFVRGESITTADVTRHFERHTKEMVGRNRRRLLGSLALGVAFGSAGAVAGGAIHDHFLGGRGGGGHTGGNHPGGNHHQPAGPRQPSAPKGVNPSMPEAPVAPPHIDTSAFEYPWNWAEAVAGRGNGSKLMLELAEKARASGHNVEWHNVTNGNYTNAWLSVDGQSNTDTVVNILNGFRG